MKQINNYIIERLRINKNTGKDGDIYSNVDIFADHYNMTCERRKTAFAFKLSKDAYDKLRNSFKEISKSNKKIKDCLTDLLYDLKLPSPKIFVHYINKDSYHFYIFSPESDMYGKIMIQLNKNQILLSNDTLDDYKKIKTILTILDYIINYYKHGKDK